jgi:hypothetical protein
MNPFWGALAILFAWLGATSFYNERAFRRAGVPVAGVIARYEHGDMGSSCSIVRIEIEGRKAEAKTGECSTSPPKIGTPVTVLYNPTENRVMTLSEHRPEYLMAIIHALLAAFAFYMGWPNKDVQAMRTRRA